MSGYGQVPSSAPQGYVTPTRDNPMRDPQYLGGGGGYPMSLAQQHETIESNLSSLLAMTGILVILAILMLFTMMHATRKNFKKYCKPRRDTQYGKRKWDDGRWVYPN